MTNAQTSVTVPNFSNTSVTPSPPLMGWLFVRCQTGFSQIFSQLLVVFLFSLEEQAF